MDLFNIYFVQHPFAFLCIIKILPRHVSKGMFLTSGTFKHKRVACFHLQFLLGFKILKYILIMKLSTFSWYKSELLLKLQNKYIRRIEIEVSNGG